MTSQIQEPTDARTRPRRRRAVSVAEIVEFLEYLAPPSLSEPDTPYGLQVGSALVTTRTVILAPLPTYSAISSAAAYKAGLLICAAPLLHKPLEAVRLDDPLGAKVAHLIQRQVSFYALANAYAAAPGGFDDSLAERLGLAGTRTLVPTQAEGQSKFVVFVPSVGVERVRNAAAEAGAGVLGAYTHCAFQTQGVGTFIPQAGSNPSVGKIGKRERVEETRLEMLVSEREMAGVIAAVLGAHPYEEVAYDIYPLRNPGVVYGRGRIGELPLKVSLDTVLAQVNDALGLTRDDRARCLHRTEMPIGSLAAASGSSGATGESEGLLRAAHRQAAGAFVTGGVSIADLTIADNTGTVLIDVGFAPSVAPGLQQLAAQLRETFCATALEVVYAP